MANTIGLMTPQDKEKIQNVISISDINLYKYLENNTDYETFVYDYLNQKTFTAESVTTDDQFSVSSAILNINFTDTSDDDLSGRFLLVKYDLNNAHSQYVRTTIVNNNIIHIFVDFHGEFGGGYQLKNMSIRIF